jgi:hypothetical protein
VAALVRFVTLLPRAAQFHSSAPFGDCSNSLLRPLVVLPWQNEAKITNVFKGGPANASPTDDSLRIYAVEIWQDPPQSWGPGCGVYLGEGLMITAAHVVTPVAHIKPSVRIADGPACQGHQGGAISTEWI